MIEVCRETRGRGIVIFWKKEIDFSLGTFSPNHIDGIVNMVRRMNGGLRVSMGSLKQQIITYHGHVCEA